MNSILGHFWRWWIPVCLLLYNSCSHISYNPKYRNTKIVSMKKWWFEMNESFFFSLVRAQPTYQPCTYVITVAKAIYQVKQKILLTRIIDQAENPIYITTWNRIFFIFFIFINKVFYSISLIIIVSIKSWSILLFNSQFLTFYINQYYQLFWIVQTDLWPIYLGPNTSEAQHHAWQTYLRYTSSPRRGCT